MNSRPATPQSSARSHPRHRLALTALLALLSLMASMGATASARAETSGQTASPKLDVLMGASSHAGELLTAAAPAGPGTPPWPIPADWMPLPGDEFFAHQDGGLWDVNVWNEPEYDAFKRDVGLAYPSAADLVAPGTTVQPRPHCAANTHHPDLLEMGAGPLLASMVNPTELTVTKTGANQVYVFCTYFYEHPGTPQEVEWGEGHFYKVRVQQKPVPNLEVSDQEASPGETIDIPVTVRGTDLEHVPSGTVRFSDESGTVVATTPLSDDGTATITTPELPAGTNDFTVRYLGDENYDPVARSVVVTARYDTRLTMSSPVTVLPGRAVHLVGKLAGPAPERGTPALAGTIHVSEGGETWGDHPVPGNGALDIDLGEIPFPRTDSTCSTQGASTTSRRLRWFSSRPRGGLLRSRRRLSATGRATGSRGTG